MKTPKQEYPNGRNEQMAEKVRQLDDRFSKLLRNGDFTEVDKAYKDFAKKLLENEKYGGLKGCQEYAAFHILAGGTFELEDTPYFDFPGDDSIGKFMDEMLEQMEKK